MNIILRVGCTLLAGMLLGACTIFPASSSLEGAAKSEVRSRLGSPAWVDQFGSGERWQYDAGPDATQAFFVHFDAEGTVRAAEPLRNEKKFGRIRIGMTETEVIDEVGHPPKRHSIARDRGYVWSYRPPAPTLACLWFQVEFTPEGRVRSTAYNRRPISIPCR